MLRFVALNHGWVRRSEIMDAWSRERNEKVGVSTRHIVRTLRNLLETNCVQRREYRNGRRGRNPYMWRATEQGKRAACKLWGDLEYDERTERVRSV